MPEKNREVKRCKECEYTYTERFMHNGVCANCHLSLGICLMGSVGIERDEALACIGKCFQEVYNP